MADKMTGTSQPKAGADLKNEAIEQAKHDLEQARSGLAKLPILGPALWLYGRDPIRKFSFMADIDWLLLPPVVLDQCRLVTRDGIPYAFFTWAFVNDTVDARLRSGVARLAPNEWKSGPHAWLVDLVAPFGGADEMVAELLQTALPGHTLNMLRPDPQQGGKLTVHTWPAHTPGNTAKH